MSCGWPTSRPCARPAGSRRDKRVSMTTASGLTIFRLRRGAAALVLAAAAVTARAGGLCAGQSLAPASAGHAQPVPRAVVRVPLGLLRERRSRRGQGARGHAARGAEGRRAPPLRLFADRRLPRAPRRETGRVGARGPGVRRGAQARRFQPRRDPGAPFVPLPPRPDPRGAARASGRRRRLLFDARGARRDPLVPGALARPRRSPACSPAPCSPSACGISRGPGTTSPSGPGAPTDRRPSFPSLSCCWVFRFSSAWAPSGSSCTGAPFSIPYTEGRERTVLAAAFVALPLVPPLMAKITRRQHRGALASLRRRARPRGAPRRRERRGRTAPGGGRLPRGLRRLVPARHFRRALRRSRARAVRLRPGDAGRSGGLPPPPESGQRAVHGGRLRRGHPRLHRGGQARPAIRGGLLQPLSRPRRGLRLRRPGRRDPRRPGRSRTPRSTAGPTTRLFPESCPPATRWTARGAAWRAWDAQPKSRRLPGPRQRPRLADSTSRPGRSPPLAALALGIAARAPARPGRRSSTATAAGVRSASAAAATATPPSTARVLLEALT